MLILGHFNREPGALLGHVCRWLLIIFYHSWGRSLSKLLSQFGVFSGFKVNEDKSSITLLNEQERRNPEIPHPFINATEGIVYLGIKITPSLKTLNTANYEPVLSKVKNDTATWTRLPLSIIGRINIIKINMLPKFLYIFQSIPLAPPSNFFSQTKKLPSNCIWSNRKPRLWLSLIFTMWERGITGTKFPIILLGSPTKSSNVLVSQYGWTILAANWIPPSPLGVFHWITFATRLLSK